MPRGGALGWIWDAKLGVVTELKTLNTISLVCRKSCCAFDRPNDETSWSLSWIELSKHAVQCCESCACSVFCVPIVFNVVLASVLLERPVKPLSLCAVVSMSVFVELGRKALIGIHLIPCAVHNAMNPSLCSTLGLAANSVVEKEHKTQRLSACQHRFLKRLEWFIRASRPIYIVHSWVIDNFEF